jgi:putative transposase
MRIFDFCKKWRMPEAIWKRLKKLIPKWRPSPLGGRPRLDPRRVADGIYYVFRTGCHWKAAPPQFGSGSCLHNYFQCWTQRGVFRRLWKEGLLVYDRRRHISWRWQTLDATIIKAPLGGEKTGKNPTDRGKLGTKRSVMTDGRGVPLAIVIGGANQHDVKLTAPTLAGIVVPRPQPDPHRPQHMHADKGYDSSAIRRALRRRHYTEHIPHRGYRPGGRTRSRRRKPRRWVNERTHSWINRFRGLLIRWEKKADNYLAALQFAAAYTAFRTARVFG